MFLRFEEYVCMHAWLSVDLFVRLYLITDLCMYVIKLHRYSTSVLLVRRYVSRGASEQVGREASPGTKM